MFTEEKLNQTGFLLEENKKYGINFQILEGTT